MKITKRQLKKLIREERILLERRKKIQEHNANYVAEGIRDIIKDVGAYAKAGAASLKDVGSFVDGVKKFLQNNREWIEPLWEMLKELRAEGGSGGGGSQLALPLGESAKTKRYRSRRRR